MVPWLSEQEPTGGFFREDVEIGVVARGHEFLRGVNGFLDCQGLNLGLMDILQSFSFFIIDGGETLCPVVKHEAQSWAAGELNHACLPIYRRIVLLQPCVT